MRASLNMYMCAHRLFSNNIYILSIGYHPGESLYIRISDMRLVMSVPRGTRGPTRKFLYVCPLNVYVFLFLVSMGVVNHSSLVWETESVL